MSEKKQKKKQKRFVTNILLQQKSKDNVIRAFLDL